VYLTHEGKLGVRGILEPGEEGGVSFEKGALEETLPVGKRQGVRTYGKRDGVAGEGEKVGNDP